MWCVPMMVGRWDFMLAPLCQGLVSLDGMKSELGRHRARNQPLDPPGRSHMQRRGFIAGTVATAVLSFGSVGLRHQKSAFDQTLAGLPA
jgi:hypothetical protein